MSEEKVIPLGLDINAILTDMYGKPLIASKPDGEKDVTLGDCCVAALMASLEGDKSDGVQKLKRFNLAQKVVKAGEKEEPLSLNSKDKKLILDQAEKMYSTLYYARIYEVLEGSTEI